MAIRRFDVPSCVRQLIKVATNELGLDYVDIIELTSEHGDDWMAWANALCEIAYANHHSPAGSAAHSKVVQAAEHVWKAVLA